MLGKLIKYDLFFGVKRYFLLAEILVLFLISGLFIKLINVAMLNQVYVTFALIFSIVYLGLYLITSVQFFFHSLSGDESVLNYTLPVKTSKMVGSKLISIWTWGLVTVVSLIGFWFLMDLIKFVDLRLIFGDMDGVIWWILGLVILQFLAFSCIFAFSISLYNTPKLKNINSGLIFSVVVAYGILQVIGIVNLGIVALVFYLRGNLEAVLNSNSLPDSELKIMFMIFAVTFLITAPTFFLLTTHTVEKHRSI